MNTNTIRKELTNNKNDKLTFNKESEIYTFKTETNNSSVYIVNHVRSALRQFEPEFLEFSKSTKSWKPKIVTVKFYLRSKKDF